METIGIIGVSQFLLRRKKYSNVSSGSQFTGTPVENECYL